jgi:hypothetical protein
VQVVLAFLEDRQVRIQAVVVEEEIKFLVKVEQVHQV